MKTLEESFWSKVDVCGENDCWNWRAAKSPPYGVIRIRGKSILAHRLSYTLKHGPIPKGLQVLHNCPDGDNPACVNPAHLWLGTQSKNMKDMAKKGRASRDVRRRSLTDEQIIEIRVLCRLGTHLQKEIAEQFHVSQSAISNIKMVKRWRSLI